MPEQTRDDILRDTHVEEIYNQYRKGRRTRGEINEVIREKAQLGPKDLLEKNGYMGAIYGRTIEHVQASWDSFIEGFTKGDHKFAAYDDTLGRLMWLNFKIGAAPFEAWGDINRAQAEQIALKNGASPGVARGIGITAEIGTGFLPTRALARGIQKGAESIKKVGDAARKAAGGKVDEAAAIVQKEDEAAKQVIDSVVKESLEADGIAIETIAATGTEGPKTLIKAIDPLNRGKRPKLSASLPSEIATGLDVLKAQIPKFGATPTTEEFETLRKLARAALKDGTQDAEVAFAKYMAAFFSPPTAKAQTKSLMIGRGAHGSVKVVFPDVHHADLYSAIGRSNRKIANTPGIDPNWEGLAYKFGVDKDVMGRWTDKPGIGKLSADYREKINNMVKGHKEGATVNAPHIGGEPEIVSNKINYSKQMMGLLTEWAPEAMAKGDMRGAMKILAEDIAIMSVKRLSGGANLNLVNLARQNQGFFAGMREVYTNTLLPLSAPAAFIGNSIAMNMAIAERAMISPTQGYYLTKGMTLAVGDGLAAFHRVFQATPNPNTGRFAWPITGPVPTVLGRILRKPTELIAGVDNFFVELFTRGSFYATAAREGMEQGLRGQQLGNFIRNAVQNVHAPNNALGNTMRLEAHAFSRENTFQNELNPLAHEIQSLLYTNIPGTNFRPGQFFFPFMKSAINLVKYGYDRTPLIQMASYRLWSDMRAGGARGDAAAARLVMGNMLGMYFYEMAKEGWITGTGPADPRQRETWLLDNKPHSVKLGDGKFISHTWAQPVSMIASMVADFAMIQDQIDNPTAIQMAHAIVFVMISNFGNNSWWMGASQLADLVQGDVSEERAKKIIAQPIVNVLHGGPAGTRAAQLIDPIVREQRTWWDQIIAGVPIWSSTLPPARDVFSDPLKISRPLVSSWFGLFGQAWPKYTDLGDDPIKQLAAKLQVQISKFPDTLGYGPIQSDADITPEQPGSIQPMSRPTNEQKDKWQELTRQAIRHPRFGMQKQIDGGIFKSYPIPGKRADIQGMITDARNAAKDLLLLEDKELARKIYTNQAEAAILKLPEAMQPKAQQAFDRGMSIIDSLNPEQLKNIMKWGDPASDLEAPEGPLQLNVSPR